MHPGSAAICELRGREVLENRAEHYRGHLENARAYLELVEKARVDPALQKLLGEPEPGR